MLEMPPPPLLEVSDVTVQRGDVTILDSLSVVVPHGEHTAILGPNGSGKTSLLRVLLRHYYPSVLGAGHQGTVRVLGRSDWEVAALRRQMGVVSASVDEAFGSGRSGRMEVADAVASGFTATELPDFVAPPTRDSHCSVRDALGRVEATHLWGRTLATLSTGERRRVMIARALVHHPSILVLDEPTTGLDIAGRHRLIGTLRQIARSGDVTMVVVTHHVEEVIPEIDHVLLLDRGRVAFAGTKKEALTDARLSALYAMPVRVGHHTDGTFSATVCRD